MQLATFPIVLVLLTAPRVFSFPTGPPVHVYPDICASLNPSMGHGSSDVAGVTPIPYEIILSTEGYIPSQSVDVTLKGKGDPTSTFEGFILQARDEDTDEIVGTWQNVPALTQGVACISDTTAALNSQLGMCSPSTDCGNTWAHSSNIDRSFVTATWVSPGSSAGNIYFQATVVVGPSSVYYEGLRSPVLLQTSTLPDAMQISIKQESDATFIEKDNNAVIQVTPGSEFDFRCEVKNSDPVVDVSWTVDGDVVIEDVSSFQTYLGNGLFDYNSFILGQTLEMCVQVTCTASNDAIIELSQQASWIRTVNIQISGLTSSVEITPPTFSELVRGQLVNGDTLQLHEGDTYSLACRTYGADPDTAIHWMIDDCSGGSMQMLQQRQFTESIANCVAQDDTDVLEFTPIFPDQQGFCLRCVSGGLSDVYKLDVIELTGTCPASNAVIWEYEYAPGSNSVKRPFYYTDDDSIPGFSPRTVVINAGEERQLNCTSYESAPVTYIAWRTPNDILGANMFISSDCTYQYEESAISISQPSVTKYDTTKCVKLTLTSDWHEAQIQCTATNIADYPGVDSLPVNVYLCVPCEVNLEFVAYNFQDNPFPVKDGTILSLNANGDPRKLSCINEGARGLEATDRPSIEFYIKEYGSRVYEILTEADDGVELIYERLLYNPEDSEYSKAKYKDLWEVRKDVTLSAESRFNLEGAILACVCRNRVYKHFSEARREVELTVNDTPLISDNFILVSGYPFHLDDVSNTDIIIANYGPFYSESDRKKREAPESVQLTCIARGTRPAVDITWRLNDEIISDDYIDVTVELSILTVGAGQQLVDTISTLTCDQVSRDPHYKHVSCEAAGGNGELIVRSARIVVLSPPDTPLELYGNNAVRDGELVTLECESVNGYPEGVFIWTDVETGLVIAEDRHETELEDNDRFEQESYYSFLASRYDNGRVISCELLQDYEEYGFTAVTSQTIEISVNYCPSTYAQLTGCPNSPILPGQPITLECQSGITDPASYLTYVVDNEELPPVPPSLTIDNGYGQTTTLYWSQAFSASDDGVKVGCCHRTALGDMGCPELCSNDCTINVQEENPFPPSHGCRWVRVRLTLENIDGNNAVWDEAYENRLSSEYQYLTSRLIDTFREVYDGLPNHRSAIIPTIRRAPEDLIQVMIGLEFLYPYGTSLPAIRHALTSRLDLNGVIRVDGDYGNEFDVLPDSIGEECVCPASFCLRGPSCVPSPEDYSSSCQCPTNYAPPRCELIPSPPNPNTREPEQGVTYGRLVFTLSEIDDRLVFWDPIYDDFNSYQTRDVRDGLQLALYEAFSRRFPCLQKVTVADFFEMYGRNLAVIVGLQFYYDCGNSINAIRSAFIESVDEDGKVDGSIYELRHDFTFDIGVEEVCGPYFSCANGGVCEPSEVEYSSSCRCPPFYAGSRCERVIVDRPTQRPPPPRPTNVEPQKDNRHTIIIIVASILGGAILIGSIVCVCVYCFRPTTRRTHYVDRYAQRQSSYHYRARRGRGRPPVRDSYDRNYNRKPRLIY